MFCLHCGNAVEDGTKFCPFCGNEADKPAEAEPMNAADRSVQMADSSDVISDVSDNTDKSDVTGNTAEASPVVNIANSTEDNGDTFAENSSDMAESSIDEAKKASSMQAAAVKPNKTPIKRASTGVTVAVSALFTVITLVLAVCTTSMWAVRAVLDGGMMSEFVSDINPLYIKASDVFTDPEDLDYLLKQVGIEEGIDEISADDTIGDIVDKTLVEYGLSEDRAERLLEESALVPYLTDVVKAYENYLLTGVDTKPITDKALKQTIMDCVNFASNDLGVKFAPDFERQIDKLLKDNKDIIRAANPTEALGIGGGYIRYIFLVPVLIAASIITIAVAVLAGVITKRVDAALITLGIPTVLCGMVCLFTGLFPRVVLSCIGIPNAAVGSSVEVFGAKFTEIGLAEFGIGVILIALFVVYQIVLKKLADKTGKNSASSVQNV